MPTYEYACTKCGLEFEIYQSMKDNALTTCPKDKCGKKTWGKGKVKKLMGAGAGLIFKGSGFYITDYRSENYKQSAKSESGAGKTSEAKSKGGESKSGGESKAAPAKSEAKSTTAAPKAK